MNVQFDEEEDQDSNDRRYGSNFSPSIKIEPKFQEQPPVVDQMTERK